MRILTIDDIALKSKGSICVGPFGSKLKSHEYQEDGVPVIRGTNLKDEAGFGGSFVFISEEKAQSLRSANLDEDDLVFPHRGAIGEVGITTKEFHQNAVISSSLMKLKVNTEIALPYYVYTYFKSPKGKAEILQYGSTVGTPGIGQPLASLKQFKLPIPDLIVQKRIVKIIKDFDDKIALNRRTNETLEAMAQALFKSWFVDFDPVIDNALDAGHALPDALATRVERRTAVRASGKYAPLAAEVRALFPASFAWSEALGKFVPEGWGVKPIGALFNHVIGGDWGKEAPDEKHTESCYIIRGTDFDSLQKGGIGKTPLRYVEPKKLVKRQLLAGDILLEVSGGSPTQSTGRSIRITDSILKRLNGVVEPASFCRLLRPIDSSTSDYARQHIKMIYEKGKMWGYQIQSTGISNFQTPFFLENEIICFPPEVIREKHSALLEPIYKMLSKDESSTLSTLRDVLLGELIG